MDAHSSSIRCGPQGLRIHVAAAAISLLLSTQVAWTADYTNEHGFSIAGAGILKLDQPTQHSGSLQLKANLTPKDAAVAASPPVQEGGGFVVMAKLAALPLVCYNDTIFRDDFDGDGG